MSAPSREDAAILTAVAAYLDGDTKWQEGWADALRRMARLREPTQEAGHCRDCTSLPIAMSPCPGIGVERQPDPPTQHICQQQSCCLCDRPFTLTNVAVCLICRGAHGDARKPQAQEVQPRRCSICGPAWFGKCPHGGESLERIAAAAKDADAMKEVQPIYLRCGEKMEDGTGECEVPRGHSAKHPHQTVDVKEAQPVALGYRCDCTCHYGMRKGILIPTAWVGEQHEPETANGECMDCDPFPLFAHAQPAARKDD